MSNAPRVTAEQVEQAIIAQTFTVLPDGRTTVCQLTLDNGFTVEGTSACVSKENYDEALGNKYARERAFNEAWKMLGFRLADALHRDAGDWIDRARVELKDLQVRLSKLNTFLTGGAADTLPTDTQDLLTQQRDAMNLYRNALTQRIEGAQQ